MKRGKISTQWTFKLYINLKNNFIFIIHVTLSLIAKQPGNMSVISCVKVCTVNAINGFSHMLIDAFS